MKRLKFDFLMMLFVFALSTNPLFAIDKLVAAVSILPQLEFVESLAATIDLQTMVMIPPGASPATYELTPSQMKDLSKVDVYFKVGTRLPFEQVWLDKITNLNPKMLVVDCSEGIEIIEGEEEYQAEPGQGHHHGRDPHVWCSPRNVSIMIDNMAKGLIAIYPDHKADFEKNAIAYKNELGELDRKITALFVDKVKREFIIYHPAWGYFARDYNLTQIPIESEGKEPSVKEMKRLIIQAKQDNLRTVFASPQFNTVSAEQLAREIGGSVILIDHLRRDYVSNMIDVASKLANAMR